MKKNFAIIISLIIFSSLFVFAESDKEYTDKKIKVVISQLEETSKQLVETNNLLTKLSEQVTRLNKENDDLKSKLENVDKKVDSNIKDTGNIAGTTKRHTVLTLSILIPITIIVTAFFVYVFYPSRAKKGMDSVIASTMNNVSQSKCPMCGWEHAPDDKVCKNCGTKF